MEDAFEDTGEEGACVAEEAAYGDCLGRLTAACCLSLSETAMTSEQCPQSRLVRALETRETRTRIHQTLRSDTYRERGGQLQK